MTGVRGMSTVTGKTKEIKVTKVKTESQLDNNKQNTDKN